MVHESFQSAEDQLGHGFGREVSEFSFRFSTFENSVEVFSDLGVLTCEDSVTSGFGIESAEGGNHCGGVASVLEHEFDVCFDEGL